MLKHVMTLLRGTVHQAQETFVDRHALPLLKQQLREAAETVRSAQKAVAIAVAQSTQEAEQHKKLLARLADLETRAIAALEQNRPDLAQEAAEAIALMESERDTSEQAQAQFAQEIARLKRTVQSAETRLRALKRGERLATATDKTQRLQNHPPNACGSSLEDAEKTLKRLRERQLQIDLTGQALEEMGQATDPSRIAEKLADAGCGTPIKTSAQEVLARLKEKAASTGPTRSTTNTDPTQTASDIEEIE